MKLSQVRCVITGGASGMGRVFVAELLKAGGLVSVWDMNTKALHEMQEQDQTGRLWVKKVDVSKEDQVCDAMQEAWENLGGFNCLINNAGIFRDGLLVKKDRTTKSVLKMSLEQWQRVIDVDLTGPFLCAREFSSYLVDHPANDAVIVNISSISKAGNIGQSNYSAAKAGLIADTVTWAKELARYKIRVAAIAPGFVETPILKGMKTEMIDKMVQIVPMRRLGSSREIFAGVRFICECEYFTGRCLEIDGGLRI